MIKPVLSGQAEDHQDMTTQDRWLLK